MAVAKPDWEGKAPSERKGASAKWQDEESKAMLFEGASLSQLSKLFGKDNRTTALKMHGVPPIGTRAGSPIYSIKEAARYLATPAYDIDEFIQRMTIADLPVQVRKEFWAAQRSRQIYEKEAGELWPTDAVVAFLGDLFKTLKMSLLLTRDSVERETELSDRQRQIIRRIIDGCLAGLNESAIQHAMRAKAKADATEDAGDPLDEDDEL